MKPESRNEKGTIAGNRSIYLSMQGYVLAYSALFKRKSSLALNLQLSGPEFSASAVLIGQKTYMSS